MTGSWVRPKRVLSEAEEARLVAAPRHSGVRAHGLRARCTRPTFPRRTVAHYGWDYGYESWSLTPAPPLPRFLEPVRERCAAVAGLEPAALEELLVSRYPPGASIGWHRDAPMFGPCVIGVSLLGPARMRFRRKVGGAWETYALELAPRSAYLLAGAARSQWQHTLSPVKTLRYSLSFRTVSRKPPLPLGQGGG